MRHMVFPALGLASSWLQPTTSHADTAAINKSADFIIVIDLFSRGWAAGYFAVYVRLRPVFCQRSAYR